MKYGIKVGPRSQSIADIESARPDFVEVWYDGTQPSIYDELFSYLDTNHIETGLHYWTKPDNTYFPSITIPNSHITNQTVVFIKDCIDVAFQHHFSYVNIHPGPRATATLDYEQELISIISEPAPIADAVHAFLQNAKILNSYALDKSIVLTVETVPLKAKNHWISGRTNQENLAFPMYEVPYSAIKQAADMGISIANDFSHTTAMYDGKDSDLADPLWQFLSRATDELFTQTRLIHVSYCVKPFTQTDFHDMLDNPILHTDDAVPNLKQMKNLLSRFIDRPDVWVLVEPVENHPKNYGLLKDLITDIHP